MVVIGGGLRAARPRWPNGEYWQVPSRLGNPGPRLLMTRSSIRRPVVHGGCFALLCVSWFGLSSSVGASPRFRLPFSFASQTPHPAVARINVAEQGATSHGTGTLVNVAGQHGLVVTNWHVVRDSVGEIFVEFPDGFRSAARVLKVDHDWDLAALQIWRPATEPVPLAVTAPRPGDALSIAGYGSGQYRAASGRCTQYVSPGAQLPYEMVELSAEARQGDSGGPIFNERGELAGVLFGASRGTTSGSYCGRVSVFLATVVNGSGAESNPLASSEPSRGTRTVIEGGSAATPGTSSAANAASLAPAFPAMPAPPSPSAGALAAADPYFGTLPRLRPAIDLSPPVAVSSLSAPVYRDGTPLGGGAWRDGYEDQALLSSSSAKPAPAPWEELVGTTPFEQGRSILAGIGILAVLLRLSNLLAGSRR